ncbi:hypothetical protein H7J83_03350 [Mycobacterium mantenii]|uniref:hypothetical protein n=1 Tax=Mycobacterium mantenii TaxID=560555 RepID=UPI00114EC2B2|nr:hypothetical protein [Mycobacterium mantenii]MCV7241783.1 hypothetical protein [Mycobacterium mantenii]
MEYVLTIGFPAVGRELALRLATAERGEAVWIRGAATDQLGGTDNGPRAIALPRRPEDSLDRDRGDSGVLDFVSSSR